MDGVKLDKSPLHPLAQDILGGGVHAERESKGFLGQQHPPASLSSHSASGVIQGKDPPSHLVVQNHHVFPAAEAPGLGGSTFSTKYIHPPEAQLLLESIPTLKNSAISASKIDISVSKKTPKPLHPCVH